MKYLLCLVSMNVGAYCEINRLYSKDIAAGECKKIGRIHLVMPCSGESACWTDEFRVIMDAKDCPTEHLKKENKESVVRKKYRRC